MHRLLFLAFFVTTFMQSALGQTIYSAHQDASWQCRYSGSRKADYYNNQVLKQLALANLKTPENTSFTFFFNYQVSVGFQQGNQLDLLLSIHPTIATGDVEVREFDMQPMLIPAYCSVQVTVENPVQGRVFSVSKIDLPVGELISGTTIASFADSLWAPGSRAEVRFTGFRFDELSYKRIEKELFAIRDYDAASTLADTLEKQIRQARIRLHTPREAFRKYVFFSKGVFLLNESAKTKTEIVPGNDPRKVLAKVPVIEFRFSDLARFFITESVDGPVAGNIYQNLAGAFGDALGDALKLSQKVDYYSSPFYYRLYSNSTSIGQLASASDLILQFSKSRKLKAPDFKLLSRRVEEAYIHQGETLMADGRYAEAVDLLSSGQRFGSVNPTIFVSERLKTTLVKARGGLTASYIRIVQKALDNNLPSLADKYLAEAMQYATKYGMSNADSSGFAGLYELLSGKNIQAGNNFLAKKSYVSALAEFDKAANIATQYSIASLLKQAETGQAKAANGVFRGMYAKAVAALKQGDPDRATDQLREALEFAGGYPVFTPDPVSVDSLRGRIANVSFNKILRGAAESAGSFDNKKAVDLLIEATELSREFRIPLTKRYDTLVSQAAIPYTNSLLSEGRLKLWAGEPENALDIASRVSQLIVTLSLGGNNEIKNQYNSLMEMADAALCSRVKGELSSIINQAGESFSQNKFDEASAYVLKAREMIYARASCGLNTVELNKMTSAYQHPLRWNNTMTEAKSLIEAGDYFKGIELIQQAGALFNYYRLDTLGLVNTGLYELAMDSDFMPLIRHATGHYITRGDYEKSLKLLNRMRLAGASSTETAELQESLARVLAQRDVAETEFLDVKAMLKVYTGGDKWYRRFSDVYKFHAENK
ncbi:MAG: hypothetical protein CVU43_16325 [Chloroflexi bacterium HGW-Chloroflexi-5]|nr:MAG: hypothetical protein CVU43_16325 [Chloroflexi bacterium HGW-Chloroflexi-5]